jgi:prevent-host-death family protein
MTVTITATEAKNRFGEVIRRVCKDGERLVVERGGLPAVVIMSVRDYQAMCEGNHRSATTVRGRAEERADALARLCEGFRVCILYAFGSRAGEVREWMAGERSSLPPGPADVDVGVKAALGTCFSVDDKVHLALALEDLFGVSRVDLVTLSDADPFLAANIVRGERLYARYIFQADEHELQVLRQAGDLAPLERERMFHVLGGEG